MLHRKNQVIKFESARKFYGNRKHITVQIFYRVITIPKNASKIWLDDIIYNSNYNINFETIKILKLVKSQKAWDIN